MNRFTGTLYSFGTISKTSAEPVAAISREPTKIRMIVVIKKVILTFLLEKTEKILKGNEIIYEKIQVIDKKTDLSAHREVRGQAKTY